MLPDRSPPCSARRSDHTVAVRAALSLTSSVKPTGIAELSSPRECCVYDSRVRKWDKLTAGQTPLGIGAADRVTADLDHDDGRRQASRHSGRSRRNVARFA
jgi:hypothetical protein